MAYCTDLGFGAARGAEMLSLMLACGIVSRLVSGVICDRIGGVRTLLLGSALQGVGLALFLPFDGLVPLYERFGFRVLSRFELADGPTVNCMWRDAHPRGEVVVRVRAAGPNDLDELRAIFRRASLSNAGDRDALLGAPDALVWEGAELVRGGTLVAVGQEELVVGFATVVPRGDGLELENLFVDPAFMRRGVATRLVAELASEAVRSGAGWMEVTANPHAAAFYDSAGFTPIGTATTRFVEAPRLRLVVAGRKERVSC